MSLSASDIIYDLAVLDGYYTSLVPIAFVTYDWLITFDQEIDVVWNRFTKGSVLFLINRYVQLIAGFVQLVLYFGPQTSMACQATGNIINGLFFVLFVTTAVFSAARVCALTDRNWPLTILVLCLGLIPAAFNLYTSIMNPFGGVASGPVPWGGCYWISSASESMGLISGLASRVSAILCDVIVLAVTWKSIYRSYVGAKQFNSHGNRFGLTDTMLIYGIGYFGAMLLFNILQLLFDFVRFGYLNLPYQIAQFNQPIANVLVSRFLLDLKSAALPETGTAFGTLIEMKCTLPPIPDLPPMSGWQDRDTIPRRNVPRDDQISLGDAESTHQSVEGSDTIQVNSGASSPLTCISDMTDVDKALIIDEIPRQGGDYNV